MNINYFQSFQLNVHKKSGLGGGDDTVTKRFLVDRIAILGKEFHKKRMVIISHDGLERIRFAGSNAARDSEGG